MRKVNINASEIPQFFKIGPFLLDQRQMSTLWCINENLRAAETELKSSSVLGDLLYDLDNIIYSLGLKGDVIGEKEGWEDIDAWKKGLATFKSAIDFERFQSQIPEIVSEELIYEFLLSIMWTSAILRVNPIFSLRHANIFEFWEHSKFQEFESGEVEKVLKLLDGVESTRSFTNNFQALPNNIRDKFHIINTQEPIESVEVSKIITFRSVGHQTPIQSDDQQVFLGMESNIDLEEPELIMGDLKHISSLLEDELDKNTKLVIFLSKKDNALLDNIKKVCEGYSDKCAIVTFGKAKEYPFEKVHATRMRELLSLVFKNHIPLYFEWDDFFLMSTGESVIEIDIIGDAELGLLTTFFSSCFSYRLLRFLEQISNAFCHEHVHKDYQRIYDAFLQFLYDEYEVFYKLGKDLLEKEEIAPEYTEKWYNTGLAYLRKNRYTDAIKCFKKAVEIKPDDIKAWYNMGLAFLETNEYDEAITSINKAVQLKPDYADAWYNMGFAYFGKNMYDDALNCFKKFVEIKPEDATAWYNIGFANFELNEFEEAIVSFKKAIQIKPDYADAWYNLGFAYQKINKFAEAEKCFKKASDLDPNLQYSSKS